ncbi:phosphotransferase [Marinomonas epiphytica]
MTPEICIKRQLNACQLIRKERIQSLWSGYGEIVRYHYKEREEDFYYNSIVVKLGQFPETPSHPRGWNSEHAQQRKIRSYQVEQAAYENWFTDPANNFKVAKCLGSYRDEAQRISLLILEDLDQSGYSSRYQTLDNEHRQRQLEACIVWLARFHSRFIQDTPQSSWPLGLWSEGTYWHLSTRMDEWQVMAEGPLKNGAHRLSEQLAQSRFKCLVHGDAKVANFCLSEDGKNAAAVDFQYIGAGVGVQDLAYLLGSALTEDVLSIELDYLLEFYFDELAQALLAQGESQALAQQVVNEWQGLFYIAWADFHRFILGWSPNHHKNTQLSQRLAEKGLQTLRP